MPDYVVAALLVGAAAGTLSGILGVGGGMVLVPLLVIVLHQEQHAAQGIALAALVPSLLVSTWTFVRRGDVDRRAATWLAIGAVAGSIAGASTANSLNGPLLRHLFAVVLLILGYRVLPVAWRRAVGVLAMRVLPSRRRRPITPSLP